MFLIQQIMSKASLLIILWSTDVISFQPPPSFGITNRHSRHFSRTTTTQMYGAKKEQKQGKDHFDMNELRHRIQETTSPEVFLSTTAHTNNNDGDSANAYHPPPEMVHVIMFLPGTDKQSAHTIEYPKGSGINVVLAFESKASADKFAQGLKNQNFYDPTPLEFELNALDTVCENLGVFVQVVPDHVELIPPSGNVPKMGHHNPKLREEQKYLMYVFEMDSSEMEEDGIMLVSSDDAGSIAAWD